MNLPGFNGEASLYMTERSYRTLTVREAVRSVPRCCRADFVELPGHSVQLASPVKTVWVHVGTCA